MRTLLPLSLLTLLLLAAGCGGGGSSSPSEGSSLPEMQEEGPPPETPPAPVETAMFRLTFVGTWTGTSHPNDLPSGAHFSPPVGVVHRTPDILWQRDGSAIATAGIEQMAETGGTSVLRGEIASYVSAGDALGEIVASGLGATGSSQTTFTASATHALLSLTSMIAPSPDWFVGVRNVDLRPGGSWIDRLEIELARVYDSGTDSGTMFLSGNADITPHRPIHLVQEDGVHFVGPMQPLGMLVIERLP